MADENTDGRFASLTLILFRIHLLIIAVVTLHLLPSNPFNVNEIDSLNL